MQKYIIQLVSKADVIRAKYVLHEKHLHFMQSFLSKRLFSKCQLARRVQLLIAKSANLNDLTFLPKTHLNVCYLRSK